MVEEALISKSASVTMTQTSQPVQSKKVKRCNYALSEVVDQPDWFLFNTNLNAFFHHFITLHHLKTSHLNSTIKQRFHSTFLP